MQLLPHLRLGQSNIRPKFDCCFIHRTLRAPNRMYNFIYLFIYYYYFFKSQCQRKPGGAKRLGSADFLYFFSIKNQADKINFGDINKISRLFTIEIDHPACFWLREALKTTKNNGNFSGLKQFFLQELVHRFFF